jgi:hypothetical protein
MQTYIKVTSAELEDELVVIVGRLKQNAKAKKVDRDYLWNRSVEKFGSPFDTKGNPIGPGGQLITRQMMESVASRTGGVYKPSATRNARSKIVF